MFGDARDPASFYMYGRLTNSLGRDDPAAADYRQPVPDQNRLSRFIATRRR